MRRLTVRGGSSFLLALAVLGTSPAHGGPPQSANPGSGITGSATKKGPQILIPATSNPALLDMGDQLRHKPSGFACPEKFDGLAVQLMSIEPDEDSLVCDYRAGSELGYSEDTPIRYQLALLRERRGQSARDLFGQIVADGRKALKITGNHAPPWAAGTAAAPELVAFWDTDGAGVQGLWVAQAGRWIVYLRAQYELSAANDAEAGKVAQTLFGLVKQLVK